MKAKLQELITST